MKGLDREDIYARRFERRKTGKSGYASERMGTALRGSTEQIIDRDEFVVLTSSRPSAGISVRRF